MLLSDHRNGNLNVWKRAVTLWLCSIMFLLLILNVLMGLFTYVTLFRLLVYTAATFPDQNTHLASFVCEGIKIH